MTDSDSKPFPYTQFEYEITYDPDVVQRTGALKIEDTQQGVNTFYKVLDNQLNSSTRVQNLKVINPEFEVHANDNSVINSLEYNTAGNISLAFNLPANENVYPNYMNIILNSSLDVYPLLRILTSFIKSSNMMTEYYYPSSVLQQVNGVPLTDMGKAVLESTNDSSTAPYFKYWNVGRKDWWSTDTSSSDSGTSGSGDGSSSGSSGSSTSGTTTKQQTVKEISHVVDFCNAYAKKFNKLIDYIITNDIVYADDNFIELWSSLFSEGQADHMLKLSNGRGGSTNVINTQPAAYDFACGTLLLPSLVNFIAERINYKQHALSMCGYVPTNAKMYVSPSMTADAISAENKFITEDMAKNNTSLSGVYENSEANININNGLDGCSTHNFPFSSGETARVPTNIKTIASLPENERYLSDGIFIADGTKTRFPDKIVDRAATRPLPGGTDQNLTLTIEQYGYSDWLHKAKLGSTMFGTTAKFSGEDNIKVRAHFSGQILLPIYYFMTAADVTGFDNYIGVDYTTADWTKDDKKGKTRYDDHDDKCCKYKNFLHIGGCKQKIQYKWVKNTGLLNRSSFHHFTAYRVTSNINPEALNALVDEEGNVSDLFKQIIYKSPILAPINGMNLANGTDGITICDLKYIDIAKIPNFGDKTATKQTIYFKGDARTAGTNETDPSNNLFIVKGDNTTIYKDAQRSVDFYFDQSATDGCKITRSVEEKAPVTLDGSDSNLSTVKSGRYLSYGNTRLAGNVLSISDTVCQECINSSSSYDIKDIITALGAPSKSTIMYGLIDAEIDVDYVPGQGQTTAECSKESGSNGSSSIQWMQCQGSYQSTVKDGKATNASTIVYVPEDKISNATSAAQTINPLMTMRQTTRPVYMINENVIGYWINVIRSPCGAQCILNKLRDYIKNTPLLILLNKACRTMKPYVNAFFGSSTDASTADIDYSFVNIPLGPPFMHLPKTTLIELPNHSASYGMSVHSDFNVYNESAVNTNIINRLFYDTQTGTNGNYLDYLLQNMVQGVLVKYADCYDDEGNLSQKGDVLNDFTYFAIMLPSKGLQVLDIISDTTAAILRDNTVGVVKSDSWKNLNGIAYNTDIPKVLLTFKPISGGGNGEACGLDIKDISSISSAYRYIASVSVPWVCLHKTKGSSFIQVRIETRTSTDTCNQNASSGESEHAKQPADYDEAVKKHDQADGTTKDGNTDTGDGNSGGSTGGDGKSDGSNTPSDTGSGGSGSGSGGSGGSTPATESFGSRMFAKRRIVERYDDTGANANANGLDASDPNTPTEDTTGNANSSSSTNLRTGAGSGFSGDGAVPSNNRVYIYVTQGNTVDFTSMCRGNGSGTDTDSTNKNVKNGKANIMLHLDYLGLDAMYPPFCLTNRKFGNYCGE